MKGCNMVRLYFKQMTRGLCREVDVNTPRLDLGRPIEISPGERSWCKLVVVVRIDRGE